ncbi:hypothetical protein CYMTET_47454 [Cymbomonas tetramitiformis]|uniref:DNA topoisomerase n=1 Tax=Cymbomonas tetramitiformis TaxID=36881 RepID=A0AAE0BVK4_9CHLO|nr:hypothetical protein CYMTET_47454 [Cymbomonas tetramitiformis]
MCACKFFLACLQPLTSRVALLTTSASRNLVVVESPSKAKTIEKYLGEGFTVLASYGHVRDLVAKAGSVRTEDDFSMLWEVSPSHEKQLQAILDALSGCSKLILATDPDREGEAISWHVRETLTERQVLAGVHVERVTFSEITKGAVLEAMANPREISQPLVEAYLARRALDYLVGFTLSPLLWRKLPGAKSAGRVQSVVLRMLCERESQVEAFVSQEFWTVDAELHDELGVHFNARLTHLDGEKLDKFALGSEVTALDAAGKVAMAELHISSVSTTQTKRQPAPPFTTSTMQQEAAKRLGFGTSRTMSVAQRLYEGVDPEQGGLITYMRTDGVQMSADAVEAVRCEARRRFGEAHVPPAARFYKTRAKNAQEAHEAVRPTDVTLSPERAAALLTADQLKLYTLVWQRAVASQMENALIDKVKVEVCDPSADTKLSATGSTMRFKGWMAAYDIKVPDAGVPAGEEADGNMEVEDESPNGEAQEDAMKQELLAALKEGARVEVDNTLPVQHWWLSLTPRFRSRRQQR